MEHIPERSEKEFAFTSVDNGQRWIVSGGGEPDAESIVSGYTESIFARRLGALVLDNLIVSALMMGTFMLSLMPYRTVEWSPKFLLLIGMSMAIVWVYFVLLEAFFGSTIGKWALRIRVVKLDRSAPGIGRAFLRSIIKVFESSMIMLFGIISIILILVTRKKQRLGDMAAGTFVLRAQDAKPQGKSQLVLMHSLFIALSVTAIVFVPISIGGFVKLAAIPESFKTADGQYELQAPSSWSAEKDYEGELFISNILSNEVVLVGSDDESTLEGQVTLEEYNDIIADWLPGALEVELDGGEAEKISLNGHAAYRFTMNGYSEGERQAYNVTVTSDADKYYFIVAWVSKSDNEDGSVAEFRQNWQDKLDHLDEIVGTFKSVHGLVSI